MKTSRKHTIAIIIAVISSVAILVTGVILISYWNTPIAKAESRTMQAIALQEDGSAEPCTVLISGISYHYLFRNHADSFEANDPGGVFVNGSRIMDSLILPSDIDSDWMFWQDDMLWCDAAGEQFIALLHRGADGGFAETGTPVLVIAPAETKQEAQEAKDEFKPYEGTTQRGYSYTGYEYDGQKYHDVTYLGEFEDDEVPLNDLELLDYRLRHFKK